MLLRRHYMLAISKIPRNHTGFFAATLSSYYGRFQFVAALRIIARPPQLANLLYAFSSDACSSVFSNTRAFIGQEAFSIRRSRASAPSTPLLSSACDE